MSVRSWLAFAAGLGLAASLTLARPHAVERWALYVGSPAAPQRAHLFLEPFPSAASCETRARAFRSSSEAAFCSGHREVRFGDREDALLASDFSPLSAAEWFCSRLLRRATF